MKHLIISWLLVCLSFSVAAQSDPDQKVYTFGIVPQQSAARLAALWTPLLQHLSEKTGLSFQFRTAKDIPEFERLLAEEAYDFAYMNPYHFTVFNQSPGYKAVAVRDQQPITGILVVRKDSEITDLKGLANQTLAFPSPAAFAASVLPRAELRQQNIPFSTQYVSSHDSVYLNVAKGFFVAGGGVMRTLNNAPEEVKNQLKVLWTSKAYTPHAIAAAPSVDNSILLKVQTVLAQLHTTEDGLALLKSLKIKHRLIAATDEDWDDVRSLGLDLLDSLINQ